MIPRGLKNLVKYRKPLRKNPTYVISLLCSSGHIEAFDDFRREALQAAKNIPGSSSSDLKSCDYQISGIVHLLPSIRAIVPENLFL
jgi:hypothetical protein